MEKILTLNRDWETLLAKRPQNTWLPKLYLLAILADKGEGK